MSAYLTWPEAVRLAKQGKAIRREDWSTWLRLRPGWIWEELDADFRFLRVVQSADFEAQEFFASDWTDDATGTSRDVCERAPARSRFMPPGIGLSGLPSVDSIRLVADLGMSSPTGVFSLIFFIEGIEVGRAEAIEPGAYSVDVAVDWSDYTTGIRAWVDVQSELPLPAWRGHAEWAMRWPASAAWDEIDLAVFSTATEWAFCGAMTVGPYAGPRWVYSHADAPASANDVLYVDGLAIDEIWPGKPAGYPIAHTVFGGATTLVLFLPAGTTFDVDIYNGVGTGGAGGRLRVYNRPI